MSTLELKGRLRSVAADLRAARRLLDRADHWADDDDVLDLLRELQGLVVLCEESVRQGRALDECAREAWLYEHGYKHP